MATREGCDAKVGKARSGRTPVRTPGSRRSTHWGRGSKAAALDEFDPTRGEAAAGAAPLLGGPRAPFGRLHLQPHVELASPST